VRGKAAIKTVMRATCGNYLGERRPRGGWKGVGTERRELF
jgi:hypothetical protein